MESAIGLADMIQELRRELHVAMEDGENAALRFELGDIELELQVAVTRGKDGEAKAKFWVLELGGGAKLERAVTQTIKLHLKPKTRGGGPTLLSDRDG